MVVQKTRQRSIHTSVVHWRGSCRTASTRRASCSLGYVLLLAFTCPPCSQNHHSFQHILATKLARPQSHHDERRSCKRRPRTFSPFPSSTNSGLLHLIPPYSTVFLVRKPAGVDEPSSTTKAGPSSSMCSPLCFKSHPAIIMSRNDTSGRGRPLR